MLVYIDIETYSSTPIDLGLKRYTTDKEFTILVFAVSFNGEAPIIIDINTDAGKTYIKDVLYNKENYIIAHNYEFEFACLLIYYPDLLLTLNRWICTMNYCRYLGLPASLENAGLLLNSENNKQELGKLLIRLFSTLDNINSKQAAEIGIDKNGWNSLFYKDPIAGRRRLRALPSDFPEQFELYKEYCIQDVNTTIELYYHLYCIAELPNYEKVIIYNTTLSNVNGTPIRANMVKYILSIIENINAGDKIKPSGLKEILKKRGINCNSTNKIELAKIYENSTQEIKDIIQLYWNTNKSSLAKYDTMDKMQVGGRMYYELAYHKAHTGRFTGKGVQLQNLPARFTTKYDINFLLDRISNGDTQSIIDKYGAISEPLSAMIRSMIVPDDGYYLAYCDFSSIESRVLAWLANEQWKLITYNESGKVYEALAGRMFGVNPDKVNKDSRERFVAKTCELALGYQGGVNSLVRALGVSADGSTNCEQIVKLWRTSNPNTVRYWKTVENAVTYTITTGATMSIGRGVTTSLVKYGSHTLLAIGLPSGRTNYFYNPTIEIDTYGNKQAHYLSFNATKEAKPIKFANRLAAYKISLYGGKIAENIVQAVARDLLCDAWVRLAEIYPIYFTVHDEIVLGTQYLDDPYISNIMNYVPAWADGCPISSELVISDFYNK